MKIPNKQEGFMNQERTAKSYYFLVIDATLASDNFLRFRENLLEKNVKTNHDN